MYAVIDVETTGLRTSWHDRVVEIAIVQVDAHGRVERQWCSLVNPERDLGPQSIHGISAAEARRAPTFAELGGAVAGLLDRRTLVAHNLAFDAVFVRAEFDRMGFSVPVGPDLGLCTMRLANHFLPTAARSLRDCRRQAGLGPHNAHSALHDAVAAADLLACYLAAAGQPPPWTDLVTRAGSRPWPVVPTTAVARANRRRPDHREPHFLARLVDRLPRLREPRGDSYLDLLDRALLDRHVSDSEADALVDAAHVLGLARDDAMHLHRRYLDGLATAALDDGVLTADERQDLHAVARLLGLDNAAADEALTACRPAADQALATSGTPGAAAHGGDGLRRPAWRLSSGDVVVFTGTMRPPREEWEAEALRAGLRVGDSVTKKTSLLIAADPDSMSGKAKKARRYGVPIVHPTAYRRMLDAVATMR